MGIIKQMGLRGLKGLRVGVNKYANRLRSTNRRAPCPGGAGEWWVNRSS